MAMTNRMRKSGMGTTNRFQTGGSYLPAIGSATKPMVPAFGNDPTSGSQTTSLNNVDADGNADTFTAADAHGDSMLTFKQSMTVRKSRASIANLGDTLSWDAEPPSLPGKSKLYDKTLRALTPPGDKDIDQLIDNMQYRMSQMKLGTIERLFLHFDANKSTDIEREEVRQLLHVFNEFPSDEKFEKIYHHLDINGDGVITYGEFCKGLCLPVDGDADKVLVGKRHTGMTEEDDDHTKSTQIPRRKTLRPKRIDGVMHGSGLSYTEGEIPRMLPAPVAKIGTSKKKRKLGRQNSKRITLSSKNLLDSASDTTSDLWDILRQHAIQNGQTQLGWFRWLETGVPKTQDQSIEVEELCDILQRKLSLTVSPSQVQKMVDDLQLHGQDGEGINIHALNETFGPKSTRGVLDDADRSNLAVNEKSVASPSGRGKSTKYYLTGKTAREQAAVAAADEPQEEDPVLAELAVQVQSGPTDVSHAKMLKEFRRADPKGTGHVSLSEFQNILTKVVAKTAMKDLGMERLAEMATSNDVNYNTFITYCMEMGGAYGANRGAAVKSLGRYNPIERIEQQTHEFLDRHGAAPVEEALADAEEQGTAKMLLNTTRSSPMPAMSTARVAGYGWRVSSVDQLYQNTDHITVPTAASAHFGDDTIRNTSKLVCDTYDKPRHPSLHVPEGKLRRLQEGRKKVESKVFEEDSRDDERHTGRIALFKKQNETYNFNLMNDERAPARHLGDSYATVRYQPFGDLNAQSYLLVAQREERAERLKREEAALREAQHMGYRGERMRRLMGEDTPVQYQRLPFVGR